jgi:hypothetical protein
MKHIRLQTPSLLCLFFATVAYAQQPQPTAAVPKLVRFSGSVRPPAQSAESVTLSVYRDQTGGTALWSEIQNITVDADGRYSLLMGATQSEGMPLALFSSGEPRWLGAQFNRPGEVEQPRVLLVSVPYALKASDADTLGGRPASAYLLGAPPVGTSTGVTSSTTGTAPAKSSTKSASPANSGMPNYIGKFVNTSDLVDSAMYEINGAVGIGTTQPGISLDVRTGSLPQMGIAQTTDYLTFFASDIYGPAIYWDPAKDMRFGKGGSGLYNPFGFVEQVRIQSSTGNVGIGTMTPGSRLDVAGDVNLNGNLRYGGNPLLRVSGSSTGLGLGALANNTANFNTAIGTGAMQGNTSGSQNTATGYQALETNTTGGANTAVGFIAMEFNTTGSNNTAIGFDALFNNTTGGNNVAIGSNAANNVSAGNGNNIHIGSRGSGGDSGAIRLGDPATQSLFFAAGIRGITTGNNDAIPVMIDSTGQLGTVSSSRRFKEDIHDMGSASHDLMRLRPVTFRYKEPFADGSKPIQYGLIAEEVAEVYPELVAHSADGQIETVKYQALGPMLLNEVQRQQAEIRGVEQQNQSIQDRLDKLETALNSMSRVPAIPGIR